MGFLEDRDMTDVPSIPEFYKGKTIFITGGSGFIGKILIEKLLYSCTELDRIYLLMRNKKGVKSEDRLEKLYATPCFDRLRKERPGVFESKVFVIAGDVMEPGLGLSQEDRTLLVNKVNIVFHIAASVRFDDTLKFAIQMNLKGTLQTIELAKEIRDLCVFVHVSTSYSNTNRDPIEEVLYPPLADWRETLKICETADDHALRVLTTKYLGELPNTYTFSKQLAEQMVCENKGQLPIVIVRPSIVISSVEEPVPGWVENFNGPVGIFVACGKGIMRSIYTKPEIVCDFIPVDVCAKNIAVAAWIRGTKKLEPTDDIPFYNCCSGKLNSILMKDLVDMSKLVAEDVPLDGMLWSVGGKITANEKLHYIKVLFQHLLPALFVDTLLWLLGKKPMLIKVQRRIFCADLALRYYTNKQWTFDNKNFIALRSVLKEQDRDSFYYQVENVDIIRYFKKCCFGGRKFLMKEKDEDLPAARVHFKRMKVLDKVAQLIFYGVIFYWISSKLIRIYNTSFV
ncbi:putative fatty acyl-CoA reductase CG5065 [Anticarsia gemmatalis]|uniref:putative fatty acyl-CoA reductase CG5065 n=1 Tax=Anticarsia gemmatalis TaxID=129554 RepID=UPI003F75FEA1